MTSSDVYRHNHDNSSYDVVFTVSNYWDGPREGIANYEGQPHYYRCVFNENKDEWSDSFILKPVDPETLELALEDWQIWLRWEAAYREGRVALDSHPALPEDRQRQETIAAILSERIVIDPQTDMKAEAEFEAVPGDDRSYPHRNWRVRWF